jgi:two-component system response regulator AtoC
VSLRVLVVDDEESLRHMLSLFLAKDGLHVWTASSGTEALGMLRTEGPFDVCVTDIRMPGMDGLTFIAEAQRLGDRAPTFIAMSAYGDKALAIEALRRGAFDYISKPFDPAELGIKLGLVAERSRLTATSHAAASPGATASKRSTTRMVDIVLASPEMQAIARTVHRVAQYPTTVLLTGETGTGKERIAGAIHAESKRANRPFVAVNCGAIPANLLESELFGHVKGAFTDAHADRAGLFEAADGGTLFLDEIAELPVNLQVKLLRVLVEHELRPLGAQRMTAVDVRVIAATSRDLPALLRDGHFREDLFHRLNVVPIHIPPLRERPGDVRPLVAHFARLMAQRFGLPKIEVTDDAVALLERYTWPGNVRELENALERAFVLSEGDGRVTEADLDERFAGLDESSTASSGGAPVARSDGEESLDLRERLDEVEKQVIRRALERTRGNRSRAAVVLGISHRALLYKLKEHGIT